MKKAFALICSAALLATSVPVLAQDTADSTATVTEETTETPVATETTENAGTAAEADETAPVANEETETPAPATVPETITVTVDGETIDFADQQPLIQDGRTLIPVRAVLEAMGASVGWIADTQTVYVRRGSTAVTLTIGSPNVLIDREIGGSSTATLDVPAQIIGERTLIPLRAVCEALGAEVGWDEATYTVTVTDTGLHAQVSLLTEVQEVKAEDGALLVTVTTEYPQVAETVANAQAVNAALKAQAEALVAQALPEVQAAAEADRAAVEGFAGYSLALTAVPTYLDEATFSYYVETSTYTGGAHPNAVRTGYILDLATAQETTLAAYTGKAEDELAAQAKALFAADIEANASLYLEDAAETLAAEDFAFGAYLETAGDGSALAVFFAPYYTLRPYAGGVPVVSAALAE